VLDASIDAPATRLSLKKLRPRRASLCFIKHPNSITPEDQQSTTQSREQLIEHRRNASKIPGVWGLAPKMSPQEGSVTIRHNFTTKEFKNVFF